MSNMGKKLLGDVDFGFIGAGQVEEDVLLEPHGLVLTRVPVVRVPGIALDSQS